MAFGKPKMQIFMKIAKIVQKLSHTNEIYSNAQHNIK